MGLSKVDDIVVGINESSYQDGQIGAGHPSEEYRKKWVSQLRCAVADYCQAEEGKVVGTGQCRME